MDYVIAICGAVGGWLLVAGPIYQAAIELREQEFDRDQIEQAVSAVASPPRLSPWWWLLPPVAYVLQRRRARDHSEALMRALKPEQRMQALSFVNKATGWLIVAFGAFLIAFKETWETTELFEWPWWVFAVLVVLISLLCVGHATFRLVLTDRALKRAEDAAPADSPAS
ncbi:hypothetical protein [Compostimonas suwonensis]|uniref:Uncharacterized protein n=1 Tax=Compostimonas suwonensis TaxID=1048394 RepID=A0A2M9BW71_9MICO|nr:hypothetical protein [Compostimonas suwonensis]PJJ62185.1 hypothetical protein CLV54_1982 [Compostimonas suwonensis]